MNKKTLLKNAKIYNGTTDAAFVGDVLIEGDRIAEVAPSIAACDECEVTDLHGLSLAPGFIDAHSHNDWFALRKDSDKFFVPFIRQGITTFVAGNCGLSATGFSDDTPHKDIIGGGLFFFKDGAPKGQVKDFLEAADKNMPCNLAVLAGHCTARASASGSTSNKLSPEEEKEMLGSLELALQQGAAGISLGLMYDPGLYADTDELKKVAKLCEKYDRPLTVHQEQTRPYQCLTLSFSDALICFVQLMSSKKS